MIVTIIVPDTIVIVDGEALKVDMPSDTIENLNRTDLEGFSPIAIQWGGHISEIEYEKPGTLERVNVPLAESDFKKYVTCFVKLWEKAKEEKSQTPQQPEPSVLVKIANLEISGLRAVQELLSSTATEEEKKVAQAKLDEIVSRKANIRK